MYENAKPLHDDAQTLINAIRDLLQDKSCKIDYWAELEILQKVAEIEATALNGGTLPETWCY